MSRMNGAIDTVDILLKINVTKSPIKQWNNGLTDMGVNITN